MEHARTICEHQKLLVQSAQVVRTVHIETGVNPVLSDVFLSLLNEYKGRTDVTFSHRQSRSKELINDQSVADRLLSFEIDIFVDFIQGEGRTRRELVAADHGYSFGTQFPDYLTEQYGFRTIPIPKLPYYLISLTNPARSVAPEAQRYLEMLDAQIAPLRIEQ